MTAGPSIDPEQFLHEQLAQASPDLMRSMLETFINTLLSAQADSVCGAEYGVRSPDRANRRNGYRHRDLDTRVGHGGCGGAEAAGGHRSSRTGCCSVAGGRRRR